MNDLSFASAECYSVGGANPLAATIARMMMSDAMPQLAVSQATDVNVQSVGGGVDRGSLGIA